MSWISENYEKALLGGAVVAALGLGYFGWSSLGAVEEDFAAVPRGPGRTDASVKGADKVSTAIPSINRARVWTNEEVDGRMVDLFTGVPLFVNKNDLDNPVDIKKSADIHAPIPNQWWIENRIDPGFGDSPLRDEDGDGFSNLEEFTAKTNPSDNTSYPSLVSKLKYVGDDSVEWVLRPSFSDGDGSYVFEYSDTKGNVAKVPAISPIKKGEKFFDKDPVKERFLYLGSEDKKVFNERIQADEDITIVKVEDLRPNKKGNIYEIRAMFQKARAREHSKFDRTALLSLDALGMTDQQIRVDEMTEFTLPPGGNGKPFKMMEVTPESITLVEILEGGVTKTYRIQKGMTGGAAENP